MLSTISDNYAEIEFGIKCFKDGTGCSRGRNVNDGSMTSCLFFSLMTVFKDRKSQVSGACFFGIDTSNHLGVIVECLLSLEGSLNKRDDTWLPVIPWQMTLVCLLTQTLAPVEKRFLQTLLSIKYLYCRLQ